MVAICLHCYTSTACLNISLYIANSLETELFIGFYEECAVFQLFLIYFAICLCYGT